MSGANTYSGATTINGGALEVDGSIASSSVTVNAGGTLTGIGVVDPITTTINSGGTFAPGTAGVPGTSITITGNLALQSGATYQVYLNPSTSTYAAVNGAAALAGTVNASFAAGNYVAKQYTILTTTGGLTGTFASLTNTNLPSGTSDSLSYSPDDVYLNLTPGFVNYTGLNQNQRNVANALTNYFNSTGGIPSAFFGLTPGGLTQIDGEAATGAERGAFQLTTEFLNSCSIRSSMAAAAGARWERERRSDRLHARQAGKLAAGCRARLCIDPQGPGGAGLRSALDRVGLGFRRQQHHGRRSGGRFDHGDDTDYGYAAGMDYHVMPDTVAGFALAGAGTNWGLANALGGGRSDALQVGTYGVTQFGPAYVAAALSFSNHWFTTSRSPLGDDLTANFEGQSYGARFEAGYRYALLPTLGVTPYGAVQLQDFHTPSYSNGRRRRRTRTFLQRDECDRHTQRNRRPLRRSDARLRHAAHPARPCRLGA